MAADFRDLDAAFELTSSVTDPRLRGLYEVLVNRMQNEAAHLPMNTVQQLLIERICSFYIVMKAKEAGNLGGFGSNSVQKDWNTFWLTMTAEFNRMLGKVSPMNGADRKALLREVQGIIVSNVNAVEDPKVRSELLMKMAAAFENAGI